MWIAPGDSLKKWWICVAIFISSKLSLADTSLAALCACVFVLLYSIVLPSVALCFSSSCTLFKLVLAQPCFRSEQFQTIFSYVFAVCTLMVPVAQLSRKMMFWSFATTTLYCHILYGFPEGEPWSTFNHYHQMFTQNPTRFIASWVETLRCMCNCSSLSKNGYFVGSLLHWETRNDEKHNHEDENVN